jgi:hypothetical protein
MQDFFGQVLLFFVCICGFIGFLLKRADSSGKMKKAALKAGVRGGVSLFKHLTK